MTKQERIILGIDPGSLIMGYAVIKITSTPILLAMDIIKLPKENTYVKLKIIFEELQKILHHYKPTEAAIEMPFYGKNVQSMLKLGRAQGAAITAVTYYGIDIVEYAPRKIKLAVTGNGNASKQKVSDMLKIIFNISKTSAYFDATDALGIALCHSQNSNKFLATNQHANTIKKKTLSAKNKNQAWKNFISQHTDKIVE